jgi:hypothetical protein
MRDVEALLAKLPEEARARFLGQANVGELLKSHLWLPNPGPQTDAFHCDADELFYGGSAGGGKSDLLMGLALTAHQSSLLLRRTNKEASKFIKRLEEICGSREGWNGQLATLIRPDGRIIETGGCQMEEDKQKYKGDPHDLIGFDEVSDFSETQFRFIKGWNRSSKKGQRVRVVCAGNPPTRPEGMWVIKYWAPWLDPTYPKPAKEGELRWFTTILGKDTEVDGPGPHVIPGEPKPITARSRTFIRAKLEDNPDLEDQNYDAVLAQLPAGLREAYRDGRFDVPLQDDLMQVIPTSWIMAAEARWHEEGGRGARMTAIALDPAGQGEDAAAIARRHGMWFARVIEINGAEKADGSAMAALTLSHRRDGAGIVVDVGGGYASGVLERFKDNEVDAVRFNGSNSSSGKAVNTGLSFSNKRAEAYWRLREALDPDQPDGSSVALPHDPLLRAELAAPRYSVGPNGVRIEAKDDIRERLGRSPNRADAVAMCNSEGERAAQRRERSEGRRPKVIVGYDKQKGRR